MRTPESPLARRAILATAIAAVVLAPGEVLAGVESPPVYRAAAELEPAPVATSYLPARRPVETERFELSELRSVLTETPESTYVDLGRFHLLERD